MKKSFNLFLLICSLTLSSCTFGNQPVITQNLNQSNLKNDLTQINLNKIALTKLFDIVKSENKEAVLGENEIVLGKDRIQVKVTIENELEDEKDYIIAARFDTKLTRMDENIFTVGSIGIGVDKKDAEETVVDEWIGLFGVALGNLLQDKAIKIDNLKVYSSLMGIRGQKPSNSWIDGSPEMTKKIVNTLATLIKKQNKEINSINLIIAVSQEGEIQGECYLNNEVSREVFDKIKELNWTKGDSPYMFKQFYLIKKD